MSKGKLKQIRWYSNGAWQFQPHLYFMYNLIDSPERVTTVIERLERKEIVKEKGFYFKLEELLNVG